MKEAKRGIVSIYCSKRGGAAAGEIIHLKGHTTDFAKKIRSLQIKYKHVKHTRNEDDVAVRGKESAFSKGDLL